MGDTWCSLIGGSEINAISYDYGIQNLPGEKWELTFTDLSR